MCHPVAWTAGLTIAQAALQHRAEAKYADAQNKAVLADYANKTTAMQERAEQIHAQAADEISERARAAKIESGRLRAIAAESGLGYGNTAARIENESSFNEGQDIASIQTNYARAIKQNARETQGIYSTAQGDVNQIKRPSRLATGLKIGMAAVEGYDGLQTGKPKATPKATKAPPVE
jgi:hypothetical protein